MDISRPVMTTAMLVCLIGLDASTGEGQAIEWSKIKSAKVKAAKREFDLAVKKAEGDYLDKVESTKATLVDALDEAKKEATQADKLDEAIAIRDAIKQLKSQKAPNAAARTTYTIVGKWNVFYPQGKPQKRICEFFQNGTFRSSHDGLGKFEQRGNVVLVTYDKFKTVTRITITGDRFFKEDFNRGTSQPPGNVGIGDRIED